MFIIALHGFPRSWIHVADSLESNFHVTPQSHVDVINSWGWVKHVINGHPVRVQIIRRDWTSPELRTSPDQFFFTSNTLMQA